MEKQTIDVINILRNTVKLLQEDVTPYAWTHQGHCNCGHLIQVVTKLQPSAIHACGLQKPGDWTEHARDYCPTSGLLVDDIITTLIQVGFTPDDIIHLERLSDPAVLAKIPYSKRVELDYKSKSDLILYLQTWVDNLEEQFLSTVTINLNLAPEKQPA